MPGREPGQEDLGNGHDEVTEVMLANDRRVEPGRRSEIEVLEDLGVALGLRTPLTGDRIGSMVAERE